FSAVACNHTGSCCNKPRSTLTTGLTGGLTYYILAWEGTNTTYTPDETSMQLRLNRFLPPDVAALRHSSLTSTSAVLNATVNPNGLTTTAWFEWGANIN